MTSLDLEGARVSCPPRLEYGDPGTFSPSVFYRLFQPAFAEMTSGNWVLADALQSHWDRADPGYAPSAEAIEHMEASWKHQLRAARRQSKREPWRRPSAVTALDSVDVFVVPSAEFLPLVAKCVRSEWGTALVYLKPDVPLETLADFYVSPSSDLDALVDDGLVSCIDTLFRCLSNGDWAFYTADSQRRESLSSAARACPGAVLEESLTLRPRRMHLP